VSLHTSPKEPAADLELYVTTSEVGTGGELVSWEFTSRGGRVLGFGRWTTQGACSVGGNWLLGIEGGWSIGHSPQLLGCRGPTFSSVSLALRSL